MTTLSHAHAARNDGPLVSDRAAIIAEDDRRRAPMRLFRAEAERDRARRRTLLECILADRSATHCTSEKATRLIGPRLDAETVRRALGPRFDSKILRHFMGPRLDSEAARHLVVPRLGIDAFCRALGPAYFRPAA